jgi:hypothetical protein
MPIALAVALSFYSKAAYIFVLKYTILSTNPSTIFDFVGAHFPGQKPLANEHSLFALGTGSLLGLMLLTGCPQAPPKPPIPPQAADSELHFDKHYLDSLDGPRSVRTQREMAIYTQLRRLEMSKNPRFRKKARTFCLAKV